MNYPKCNRYNFSLEEDRKEVIGREVYQPTFGTIKRIDGFIQGSDGEWRATYHYGRCLGILSSQILKDSYLFVGSNHRVCKEEEK